jgi:hypothetical protein
MNKASIRWFWLIMFFIALFVNENLVQWILAVIVGHHTVIDGFKDAFKHFSLNGYMFFTILRLVPYIILGIVVIILQRKPKDITVGIAWGGLFGIVAMILYESVSALLPIYTGQHVSSTTGLVFLVIPFLAIVTGVIGGLIGWGISIAARE